MTIAFTEEQVAKLTEEGLYFLKDILEAESSQGADVVEAVGTTSLSLEMLIGDVDAFWILVCGVLVFFMQAGFAMLCAGCVRDKNVINIMLKNVLDACVGALGFWSVGYAFGYGAAEGGGNAFIGNSYFFLSNFEGNDSYHNFFFQFAFAATAATIVSGAVAERCQMGAYLGYSLFLTSWVYPLVVHWVWSSDGFLSAFNAEPILGIGVIDFAGCGVVHMVGGLSGLLGAKFVGPRLGRFDADGTVIDIKGHSVPLQVLGTFILWVGWYGFNPGSTLAIYGLSHVAAKTATTTTLSAVGGAVANMFIWKYISHNWDLTMVCNGALAGLVSITAACSVVDPWAAVLIGVIGAMVYSSSSVMLKKIKIDDVVDAGPVHFFCGMWGLLAAALFCEPTNLANAYAENENYGLFYGGGGALLACNLLCIVVVVSWVTAMMAPFFWMLSRMGMLRVPPEMEAEGLDNSKHGGHAYNAEAPVTRVSTGGPK